MYDSSWFDLLNKPFLNPPSVIFAPVWIILYGTLLISLILYSIKPSTKSKLNGYIYFIMQLLLNLSWSPAFFELQNIKLALVIVILLDIFAVLTLIKFLKISKTAGIILVPYVLWIFFATYLNIGYLVLN